MVNGETASYRFVPTQVDAPDHIKYRRILNPWFSPKAMEAAAPMMRELCRSFIEPLVAKGVSQGCVEVLSIGLEVERGVGRP